MNKIFKVIEQKIRYAYKLINLTTASESELYTL